MRTLVATVLLSLAAAPVTAAPSFVFVLLDDASVLEMEHGAAMPRTHHLVRDNGVRLARFYISNAICCPSRVTFLTGRYSHNHGVLNNLPPPVGRGGWARFRSPGPEDRTIAVWLKAAGYRTALVGKYVNEYAREVADLTVVPPGYDYWASPIHRPGVEGAARGEFGSRSSVYNFGRAVRHSSDGGTVQHDDPFRVNVNGTVVTANPPGDADVYGTDWYLGRAVEFIDAVPAGTPFFLAFWPIAPHDPRMVPARHVAEFASAAFPRGPSHDEADTADKPAWLERGSDVDMAEIDARWRGRLGSVRAVDDAIGAIADRLAALGRLADTYLIVTSDNGFRMGHHRLSPGKNSAFEEDVRVPFWISGPGVARDATVDLLAVNTDLAPTVLELAGVPAPAGAALDGRSLKAVIDEDRGNDPAAWRRSVLLAHYDEGRTFGGYLDLPDFRGLRSGRYTFVEYLDGNGNVVPPADRFELYDNLADPLQLSNLCHGDPAGCGDVGRKAALLGRVAELIGCAGDTCRAAEDADVP
jgi:N-acetylglucosamine-6-sulfatase